MDVAQWLQAVEIPAQLVEQGGRRRPRSSDLAVVQSALADRPTRSLGKRKPPTDSSVVSRQPSYPHRHEPLSKEVTGPTSRSPSSDSEALRSPHEPIDDPFSRRRRNKTRPDRYEPKTQRQRRDGKLKDRKVNDGKTKRRKKVNRTSKDGPTVAMLDRFRASNVERPRLTVCQIFPYSSSTLQTDSRASQLPPRANIGIFKRGRASSPFRARGGQSRAI